MVARGARTERGPGPLGRPAQRRPRAPARIGGWAGLGPRCLPRCAALRTPGTVRGVGKKLEEFAKGEGVRPGRFFKGHLIAQGSETDPYPATLTPPVSGVWQCTERVSLAHVWCTQQRSLDSHLGPRGPTYAQGPRGPPGSRAAPRAESQQLATRPTSRPLLAQPHGARASPSRGAAVALGLPAEAHLQSFSPRTEIPGLQCGRRSLRFLQTPRRTLPPLPPPALGLQQPCRHPECVAWRPHRERFASGQNPDPGHPRRRGPAASRAAPERAAAPHQPPGPRSRSLRPEKRQGNFGRNFANFALGEGEAAWPAAAAAGRDAQSGPQVSPGHPGACRAAQGGVRGRLAAPGSPLRPCASPTWPSAPVSERPATRSAQDGRDRQPGLQRK
uniref:collagen alpha-2(I) chain-like n=1 Tax=Panthera onca TaxID=9690 RepID=UPI0029546CED|nr:collagen alpha-2(I) chain-like [Panthera onca]